MNAFIKKFLIRISVIIVTTLILIPVTCYSGLKAGYSEEIIWVGALFVFFLNIIFILITYQIDDLRSEFNNKK